MSLTIWDCIISANSWSWLEVLMKVSDREWFFNIPVPAGTYKKEKVNQNAK